MLLKRNRIWHYQTKIGGRTFRRSTGQTNRRKAEDVAKQIEAQVRLRKRPRRDWGELSQAMVREVARIETDISPGRAERALSTFSMFLQWLERDPDVGEIAHDVLEAYQRHRLRLVGANTVNLDLVLLLRLLRQNGVNVRKPCRKAGRETVVRPFSPNEFKRLLQHANDGEPTLYLTLLFTGARLAELVPSRRSTHKSLLKNEVDFEKGLIHIRQAKGRNGRSLRPRPPIPVPKHVLRLIREEMAKTPSDYPFVFTPRPGAGRVFDRTLKRAGIPKIDGAGRKLVIHSIRHAYATIMAEQVQHNPHFLKHLLGHRSILTTDRYCHQVQASALPVSDLEGLISTWK